MYGFVTSEGLQTSFKQETVRKFANLKVKVEIVGNLL